MKPSLDLIGQLTELETDDFDSSRDVHDAIEAAHGFLARLEKPFNRLWTMAVEHPALLAILKICVDIDLFGLWKKAGCRPQTCNELAEMARIPSSTLQRFLRHLAACQILKEGDDGTYLQTSFSEALLDPSINAAVQYYHDASGPIYLNLPSYMARTEYTTPTDPQDTVFQDTFKCRGETLFDWYSRHPDHAERFNNGMTGFTASQPVWVDVYPIADILLGDDGISPLIVDVGGNLGQDLDRFVSRYPHLASRLILQDLENVTKSARCAPEIRRMPHNFFETQPIKGARVYFLHSIVHDWPDEAARKILKNIAEAMRGQFSKLLIHDMILSTHHASRRVTSLDLQMMTNLGAHERTERMFEELLSSVGLDIVGVWTHPGSPASIIEACVKAEGKLQACK